MSLWKKPFFLFSSLLLPDATFRGLLTWLATWVQNSRCHFPLILRENSAKIPHHGISAQKVFAVAKKCFFEQNVHSLLLPSRHHWMRLELSGLSSFFYYKAPKTLKLQALLKTGGSIIEQYSAVKSWHGQNGILFSSQLTSTIATSH